VGAVGSQTSDWGPLVPLRTVPGPTSSVNLLANDKKTIRFTSHVYGLPVRPVIDAGVILNTAVQGVARSVNSARVINKVLTGRADGVFHTARDTSEF